MINSNKRRELLSIFNSDKNKHGEQIKIFLTTKSVSENSVTDEDAQTRLKEMVDKTLELASKVQQG